MYSSPEKPNVLNQRFFTHKTLFIFNDYFYQRILLFCCLHFMFAPEIIAVGGLNIDLAGQTRIHYSFLTVLYFANIVIGKPRLLVYKVFYKVFRFIMLCKEEYKIFSTRIRGEQVSNLQL